MDIVFFFLFFFFGGGGVLFNFNGVLPGKICKMFLGFSVTYNISFTKIICKSMPDRLTVVFSHFS